MHAKCLKDKNNGKNYNWELRCGFSVGDRSCVDRSCALDSQKQLSLTVDYVSSAHPPLHAKVTAQGSKAV